MRRMTQILIVGLFAVLASLGAALFFMMRGGSSDSDAEATPNKGMSKALALRVALSILLFVGILVAYAMGWVQPTGIAPGR
jgi:hypothetical protein